LQEIAARLQVWREKPQVFVRECFGVTPDAWQDDVLAAFPTNPRVAMKACKGPGKTAVLAWLGWNFLATRPHPKCAATSISGQNLADNFWTEMAKWQAKNAFLKAKFTWTKTRIVANDHPETWFMSARSWPQSADATKQADTLAGLHADYILFIIDESGGIPDAVMVSAEAALSSCVEGHIVQAGNPTMLSGPLYRACALERRLWYVIEITGDPDDAKRSPRISVEWAKAQIEKYGRDNPWVLVNVFGRFPPSSLNVLIGPDEVRAAMKRYYREFEIGKAPKILGVDVARFGDDSSVIMPRQGIQMFKAAKHRNLNSTQGAGIVSRKIDEWGADATFIDVTGGFGAGWYDQLQQLGKSPIGVEFAGQAHNAARYYNKRAEMAFDLVEWIKRGGAMPESDELLAALTQTTYTFKGDRFLLEPKEQVKEKLGYSPDDFDAAILTFAEPVTATRTAVRRDPYRAQTEYDPFAAQAQPGRALADYDPYAGR
jgi:phage terminase large subunit